MGKKNEEGVFCGDKRLIFMLPIWVAQILIFGKIRFGAYAER